MRFVFWEKGKRKKGKKKRSQEKATLKKLDDVSKKQDIGEISFILREYVKKFFRIKIEVTNQELIKRISEKKTNEKIKAEIKDFFMNVSVIEYADGKSSEEQKEQFPKAYKLAREIVQDLAHPSRVKRRETERKKTSNFYGRRNWNTRH